MVRSRSFTALPTFAALTVATGLIIGCGTANAGLPDEKWGVTLKGPDKESLDPKIKTWTLQLFDAVSCEKLSPATTIAKSGSVGVALETLRTGGYARLRPIEPKPVHGLEAFIARNHLGDPVGPEDSWRPWKRRKALVAQGARARRLIRAK